MTHDELEVEAAGQGFELACFQHRDVLVWSWRRPDDNRQPIFLSEREADSYFADWLRRVAVFE